MPSTPRSLALPLLLLPLLFAAGCDRSPSEGGHRDPVAAEVVERATGSVLARTTGSGSNLQWDAALPPLAPGSALSIEVRFLDRDGAAIPLGGEYSVQASLATGSPTGRVTITSLGDYVNLQGVAAGTVQLVFALWHGGHSDWDSPPISLTIP